MFIALNNSTFKKKENDILNKIHSLGKLKEFFDKQRVSSKLAYSCDITPKTLQRLKSKINKSTDVQKALSNFINMLYQENTNNKVFNEKIVTEIDDKIVNQDNDKEIEKEEIVNLIDNEEEEGVNLIDKIGKLEKKADNNRIKFNTVINFLDNELKNSLEDEFPNMNLKEKATLLNKLTQYLEFKDDLMIRQEQAENFDLFKQLQVEKQQNAFLTDRIRLIELNPKQ